MGNECKLKSAWDSPKQDQTYLPLDLGLTKPKLTGVENRKKEEKKKIKPSGRSTGRAKGNAEVSRGANPLKDRHLYKLIIPHHRLAFELALLALRKKPAINGMIKLVASKTNHKSRGNSQKCPDRHRASAVRYVPVLARVAGQKGGEVPTGEGEEGDSISRKRKGRKKKKKKEKNRGVGAEGSEG